VSDIQFRVLGPVELLRNGEPVPLGGNTTLALLAGLLSTHVGGYCLHAQATNHDLLRFGQLGAAAGDAMSRGAVVDAIKALDEAVGLWREPLLSNALSQAPIRLHNWLRKS
jgi:hypothetical protein